MSTVDHDCLIDCKLEEASFEVLIDSIDEAVIILQNDHTIYHANQAALKLTGYHINAIKQKNIDAVLPLQANDEGVKIPWPIRHPSNGNARLVIKNNTSLPISYTASIIQNTSGAAIGIMVLIRDIRPAKELTRLKSEFVSVVSHQLRTPASAVKWYLETLIENRHGNPINHWQEERLKQTYQSNERMIHLINDLLNVSRIDSGRFNLKIVPAALKPMIIDVSNELVHFAHAHNVSISNRLADSLPLVQADIDKVREVIMNLLTNAIKYTSPGHHEVLVTAEVKDPHVVFAVHDQGIGVPDKDLEHMFQKFYRADNAVESQTEGSGLGLYIAREIIRLHGGDIWLESKLSQGTTVFFSLPISSKA